MYSRVIWKVLPMILVLLKITEVTINLDMNICSLGFSGYLLVDTIKRKMCVWYRIIPVYLCIPLLGTLEIAIGLFLIVEAWDSWDNTGKER